MRRQPSREEFARFNQGLASLVKSGLPLSEGLRRLSKEMKSPHFQQELQKVEKRLEQGLSLSEALSQSPRFFSPYYVTLIRAGEMGGNLAEVLVYLTRYAQFQARFAAKIHNGMIYPVAQFSIALFLFLLILIHIVPRFEELYSTAGARLPALTDWVITLSHLVRFHPYRLALGLILTLVILRYLSGYLLKPVWDYIKLRLPLLGELLSLHVLAHYCEVTGYLLKQGIPLVDALRIAAVTTSNAYASGAFQDLAGSVEKGNSLSDQMAYYPLFPSMLVWMVATAQEQGRVDEVLQSTAGIYLERLEDLADRITSIIEPLMILLFGIMMGAIVIALYLPLFKVGDIL